MPGYQNLPVVFDYVVGIAYTAALIWLISGTLFRVVVWLRSRSELSIPLAPAPSTRVGVAGRLALELFIFRSLWRASRITWAASLAFHYGLLLVLLMHLRFVVDYLPIWLLPVLRISGWATVALMTGLLALFLRRCLVDRLRYISAPSDYLHLVLIMSIAASGILLKRVWPTDLYQVGNFLRGALTFSWQSLPDHIGLVVHLMLVLLLLLIYPISKLVHSAGIFVTPTFTQRDSRGKHS